MTPARTDGLGDFLWRAFASAILAVALHAADSNAFQQRGASGLRGILAALVTPPAASVQHPGSQGSGGETSFHVVDFDLGRGESELCVGAGWFASITPAFEYFTAFGLKFPDVDSLSPLQASDAGDTPGSLSVGPWAGTGLGWRPAQGLRFSVEARWNPAEIGLGGEPTVRCPFEAGLSVAVGW